MCLRLDVYVNSVFFVIIIVFIFVRQWVLLNELGVRVILAKQVALRVVSSVLHLLLPLRDILIQELLDGLRLRLFASLYVTHILLCLFNSLSRHFKSLLLFFQTFVAED